MPLTGFKCPPYADATEPENLFVSGKPIACLACKNPCMDIDLLTYIADEAASNPHQGEMISATSLNHPLATYLERTCNYVESPTDCWPRVRGTLIHGILENTHRPKCLIEEEFSCKIPDTDLILSGRIDKYDMDKEILTDYKSCHDNFFKFKDIEIPKRDHIRQINIYRLLLEANGYEVKQMEVNYITMCFTRRYWIPKLDDTELWQWILKRAIALTDMFMGQVKRPPCWEYDEELKKKNWKCPYVIDGKGKPQRGYCTVGKLHCEYAKLFRKRAEELAQKGDR